MSRAAESWRRHGVLLAFWALCGAGAPAGATAGPAQESVLKGPIKVTARHAEFDERGKRMLYRGDVKLVSAGLELRGERLELTQSGQGLYRARITGAPARLVHAGDGESPPLSARAQEIVYDTRASTLALSGGAVLTRGTDELTGERIRYDAATRRIQANGIDGGQIRLVIQPPEREAEQP